MPDIFISYSRRDKDFVTQLSDALRARGKDAWIDFKDIPASAEWLREIQDGIDEADAFLFVLSPDSISSKECAKELDHAIERRKRILPIVHRDVDPGAVRAEAAAINWVYLRDQDSFEGGLETLVKALDTDLEYVKEHTRLATNAIDWDRSGHDRARLLRGNELQEAERWLTQAAAKEPAATELQAQFVQASREAARRRGRVIFGAVAVALVVAIALAIVALIQRANAVHQSQVAFSRELDAQAQNQYNTDPELSVLLAVTAAHTAPGAATTEALRNALGQSDVRERYANPAGPIGDAVWSPDGTRLLLAEEDRRQAEIVRPGTHAKPIVLPAPGLVSQIGWDRTGRLAVTGGGQVSVWNGVTGALVRRLLPGNYGLEAAIASAGDRVANADLSGAVRVWSVASGKLLTLAAPPKNGLASCLHFSPDGSIVAECLVYGSGIKSSGGALLLYDSHTGRRLAAIPQPGPFETVKFSPDSKRIALSTPSEPKPADPGTFVFDAHTGAVMKKFPGAGAAVAWSPRGDKLAYAPIGPVGSHLYTFATGADQELIGADETVNSIAFSPNGAWVITGSNDRTARVFDSFRGKQSEVVAGHAARVTDATMNADSTLLATASDDGTARVWATPVPRPEAQASLTPGAPRGISFSSDGSRAAVVGSGASGEFLDGHTLHPLSSITAPGADHYSAGGWSPDGRWFATLSGPLDPKGNQTAGRMEIYNGRSGVLAATVAPGSPVSNAVFDSHGDFATLLADGEVDLWAAGSNHLIRTLAPAGSNIVNLAFSKDGARVAFTHKPLNGTIDVLSTSGAHQLTLHGPAPTGQVVGVDSTALPVVAAFSPDGRWIASAANNKVDLWDARSGRLVRQMKAGITTFVSLAFSPDSKTLAGGDASSAYLWQVRSGIEIRELKHANSSVYQFISSPLEGLRVGFSPDGQTLTTSGDFAIRAWNLQNGESLFNTFAVVGDMAFNPPRLLGAASGAAKLYACDLCGGLKQLLSVATHTTTRDFTAGERALYLHQ